MRITQRTNFDTLKRYLNENRESLAKYQTQLSTGKRVRKASDDNIAFATSRQLKNTIQQNKQYQTNISDGLTKARFGQDALNGMMDVFIDLNKVSVNAASDTLTAEDREHLADQVAGMKEKIIDMGNTDYNGAYIFAGTNSDTAPFELDGDAVGGVADTSNTDALQSQISKNSRVDVTISGKNLRDLGGGDDLFAVMQDMEDALRNNDREAVSNTIDRVQSSIDHLSNLTSDLGGNINRMEFLNEQLESQSISQEGEISTLTDADYAESISNFQKHEITYQAALSVHSRIMQTSLLDYL